MGNETATDNAQDIEDRIESALFTERPPVATDDEVVDDDAVELPEDDDTDSDEGEGEADIDDDVADADELTLADYLGIPDDRVEVGDDGSVTIKALVDGQEQTVSLKDLVKSHQLVGHVNNKSVSLENQRKEFEAQQQAQAKQMFEKLQTATKLASMAEEDLVAEYNSINWDALRAENPGEWTALRQQYAERAQRIQSAKAGIQQEIDGKQKEAMQAQQQQHQQHLQSQLSKVIESNPEWKDPEVFQAETTKLKGFLGSQYGFSDEDFKAVTDHRLIKLIQDAHRYHSGAKEVKKAKGKDIPKFQKPGASKAQVKATSKARTVKAKRGKLKKSGSLKDAADLLIDRM